MVTWLEKNKDKFMELGAVKYCVQGRKLRCNPNTNFHLYIFGPKKNEKIVPVIYGHVKPGGVVIDVGAHSGYFTICLSDAVGATGKVYAFEASPVIYTELRETMDENGLNNVIAINKAISDETGQIDFFLAPNWKSEVSSMRFGDGEKITIDAVTLDATIPEGEAISFVKIDVEGAEMRVLRGMDSIIRRDHPVLVIEITEPWLRELGNSSGQVFEFLHMHGYKIYEIRDEDCIEVITPPLKQIDALCIPMGVSERR